MGRVKLPLKLIPKERARRTTFAKRKKGLFKKAYELSTLCDVKVCVVIYDPTNQLFKQHQQQRHQKSVKTWPEQPHEVQNIITKYLAYKVKNPFYKKDLDLTDFFKEKIKRLQHETRTLNEKNHENMMILKSSPDHHDHYNHDHEYLWDNRIDGFSLNQLHDLISHLDKRISDANKHWLDCYNNNMMIMCMTPHDNNKYYYDPHNHDHHHMMNYSLFGSTSTASPKKMITMQDHQMAAGKSFQTSSYYDHYYGAPQYSWRHIHDQSVVSSSSKMEPFDRHHLSSSNGSFTSIILNSSPDQTDNYNEDESHYYHNLMNIGSAMFNNSNNISTSSGTSDVLHHQNGVFLNNHAPEMALQPYVPLLCDSSFDGSQYSSAMGQVYEQSMTNQFRANSSQQDVKFYDNLLQDQFGKGPAGFGLSMD